MGLKSKGFTSPELTEAYLGAIDGGQPQAQRLCGGDA